MGVVSLPCVEAIVGALTAISTAALVAVVRPEIIVRQAWLVLALTAVASILAAGALIDFAPGSAAGAGESSVANALTTPSIAEYNSLPATLRSPDRAASGENPGADQDFDKSGKPDGPGIFDRVKAC